MSYAEHMLQLFQAEVSLNITLNHLLKKSYLDIVHIHVKSRPKVKSGQRS